MTQLALCVVMVTADSKDTRLSIHIIFYFLIEHGFQDHSSSSPYIHIYIYIYTFLFCAFTIDTHFCGHALDHVPSRNCNASEISNFTSSFIFLAHQRKNLLCRTSVYQQIQQVLPSRHIPNLATPPRLHC